MNNEFLIRRAKKDDKDAFCRLMDEHLQCMYKMASAYLKNDEDVADAMVMARDAIELMGITFEDDGKPLPKPGTVKAEKEFDDDIITLVDVDFTAYRKKLDDRAVRKNCTIPYWLNVEAEKNNVNFSRVLQDALMEKLHVSNNR